MAPYGPAPDDISRKESPSQQTTTSYGNLMLSWQKFRGLQHQQRWIERKPSNSLAMLPKWLRLGRRMMHLFGKARFIHRGESWKIPLSFHPTQRERVFTQPPGDPAQAGPDRQIHPRQRGLQRNTQSSCFKGNHRWSHHCGLTLPGRDDTEHEGSGSFSPPKTVWVISVCMRLQVNVYLRESLSSDVSGVI